MFTLAYFSRENVFQVLKKFSRRPLGILVVSCENWRWAALPVEGQRDFFCEAIVRGKMTTFREAEQLEHEEDYMAYSILRNETKYSEKKEIMLIILNTF